MLLQGSLPTPGQVGEAVEKVYSRPEFAPPAPDTFWDWVGEQVGRFFAWLGGLLGGIPALEATMPVLFWSVVALLAAAALGIVGYLVWAALNAENEGGRRGGAPGVPRGRGPKTAGEWEAEARHAAAEGRLRDAALALYQALLLRLDARGAVRFDPAKTPGDYRREAARAHPEAADALRAFLRVFEPVAFGNRPLDAAGYDQLQGAARRGGAGE